MRAILTLGLLLALTACDPLGNSSELAIDSTDPIDLATLSQAPDALVGDWEWTQSVYYFTFSGGPRLETPQSAGRTQRWTFLANGRALYYENGALVRESTYEVTQAHLRLDNGYGYDFGTDANLLVLDSRPVDGPQERYVRK